jgi:hypothetical protein
VNSKSTKVSDEEFVNVQKEMEGHPTLGLSKVGPLHWMAVKRIMRYLKDTLDFKLCVGGKDIVLIGFCDVDWAKDANDHRSTTGYVFFCWRWSYFMEMQETTNHCIIYGEGGVYGY